MKTKTPLKWVLMDIIRAKISKHLTKDNFFTNYLLLVGDYSNIPKLNGIRKYHRWGSHGQNTYEDQNTFKMGLNGHHTS